MNVSNEERLNNMKKSEHFSRELELIVNEDLRMAVKSYLDEYVPDYFFEIGASSTGKYHPKFSQGQGGLVRHVKAVVMFAEELMRMNTYAYMRDDYKDFAFAACIIHDCAKYGMTEFDKTEYKNHASNGAQMFADWCEQIGYDVNQYLLDAVRTHMGQWSEREDRPFTNIDRLVHMADYMASRSFIDIPQIMEEWNAIEES